MGRIIACFVLIVSISSVESHAGGAGWVRVSYYPDYFIHSHSILAISDNVIFWDKTVFPEKGEYSIVRRVLSCSSIRHRVLNVRIYDKSRKEISFDKSIIGDDWIDIAPVDLLYLPYILFCEGKHPLEKDVLRLRLDSYEAPRFSLGPAKETPE